MHSFPFLEVSQKKKIFLSLLKQFPKFKAIATDGREYRDLLVLYLMLRSRHVEAKSLWDRVKQIVSTKHPEQAKEIDAFVSGVSSLIPRCLQSGTSTILMASLYQPPV
jgi:hypothetical protein